MRTTECSEYTEFWRRTVSAAAVDDQPFPRIVTARIAARTPPTTATVSVEAVKAFAHVTGFDGDEDLEAARETQHGWESWRMSFAAKASWASSWILIDVLRQGPGQVVVVISLWL